MRRKSSKKDMKKVATGALLGVAMTYVGYKVYNLITDKGLGADGTPYYEGFDPEAAQSATTGASEYMEVPQPVQQEEAPAQSQQKAPAAETPQEFLQNGGTATNA